MRPFEPEISDDLDKNLRSANEILLSASKERS